MHGPMVKQALEPAALVTVAAVVSAMSDDVLRGIVVGAATTSVFLLLLLLLLLLGRRRLDVPTQDAEPARRAHVVCCSRFVERAVFHSSSLHKNL